MLHPARVFCTRGRPLAGAAKRPSAGGNGGATDVVEGTAFLTLRSDNYAFMPNLTAATSAAPAGQLARVFNAYATKDAA